MPCRPRQGHAWHMTGHLLITGGFLFVAMGLVHGLAALADVFRPARFTPVDDNVRLAMQSTNVRFLRARASIWNAWLGFNLSHGLGLLVFGAAAIGLGLGVDGLAPSRLLLAAPVAISLVYLVLALRFWFWAPSVLFALATAAFAAAWWNG